MHTEGLAQFRLSADENAALAAMQAHLLCRDFQVQLESSGLRSRRHIDVKRETRDSFVADVSSALAGVGRAWTVDKSGEVLAAEVYGLDGEAGWGGFEASAALHKEVALMVDSVRIAGHERDRRHALEAGSLACARNIDERTRGLLLLIELFSFHPWRGRISWYGDTRQGTLHTFVDTMPALSPDDYRKVETQFKKALRRFRLKSTNWWKIAGYAGIAGLLSAPLAFVAAPAIGAAIGGAMGLSGAAATSAGLAALGGGSLAAGGAGMAGGTALLVVGGSVAGGLGGSTAVYFSPLARGQMIADAIKLEVLIKVLADSDSEEELKRFAVMGLNAQIAEVEIALEELATDLEATRDENKELKQRLKATEAQLQLTLIALQQALDAAEQVHHAGA